MNGDPGTPGQAEPPSPQPVPEPPQLPPQPGMLPGWSGYAPAQFPPLAVPPPGSVPPGSPPVGSVPYGVGPEPRSPIPPGAGWGPPVGRAPDRLGSGRFRAQSVIEIIDSAFTLYRRNFLLMVAIAAVILVPFHLLLTLLAYSSGVASLVDNINATSLIDPASVNELVGFGIISFALLVLVVNPLAQAALTRAVSDRYLDRPATVSSTIQAALPRLPAVIGMSLLQALFIGVTAFLLLFIVSLVIAAFVGSSTAVVAATIIVLIVVAVPVLFLYARFSLGPAAIVLEGKGPASGLNRSWVLVTGSSGRAVGLILLMLIISTVFQIVGGVIVPVRVYAVTQIVSTAVSIATTPLMLIALTLFYYDLRIRREAFDIEMLPSSL